MPLLSWVLAANRRSTKADMDIGRWCGWVESSCGAIRQDDSERAAVCRGDRWHTDVHSIIPSMDGVRVEHTKTSGLSVSEALRDGSPAFPMQTPVCGG